MSYKLKIPEGLHCTVMLPPLGVSGNPLATTSIKAMRLEEAGVPVFWYTTRDVTVAPDTAENVTSFASNTPSTTVRPVKSTGVPTTSGCMTLKF